MATTPPSNEAIQPGEKKKFDIDKALNTKGFAAFLAKHPEGANLDMENAEELEKKFEAFAVVKTEIKDYKVYLQNKFKRSWE